MFEVDHPATQAWKRQQIAHVGWAIPPTLAYAPCARRGPCTCILRLIR